MTVDYFKLSYGGPKPETRIFPIHKMNDAVVKFAEKVVELDQDDSVGAAWVNITMMNDVTNTIKTLLAWTKTSNECPTTEGELV